MPLTATIKQAGNSAIGFVGHRVHVVRRREAAWLLDALGDVRGKTVVDVAGGDGYWAVQVERRGAKAVAVDLATHKLLRGAQLPVPPGLVEGDALRLPFRDASVDGLMSMCAIEHFPDGAAALREMARVAKPGAPLALSADALSDEAHWPQLSEGHRETYSVVDTYDREKLTGLLDDAGFDVVQTDYLFRESWSQGVYLRLHRWRYAPNALAPLDPIVARSDKNSGSDGGAILLVKAVRR